MTRLVAIWLAARDCWSRRVATCATPTIATRGTKTKIVIVALTLRRIAIAAMEKIVRLIMSTVQSDPSSACCTSSRNTLSASPGDRSSARAPGRRRISASMFRCSTALTLKRKNTSIVIPDVFATAPAIPVPTNAAEIHMTVDGSMVPFCRASKAAFATSPGRSREQYTPVQRTLSVK